MKTQINSSAAQLPNYRIYDRTGGGVTHDIYAATLAEAIKAGREWIEDGDWTVGGEAGVYRTIKLECEVGEIVCGMGYSIDEATYGGRHIAEGNTLDGCFADCLPDEVLEFADSGKTGDITVDGVAYTVSRIPCAKIDREATQESEMHDCSGQHTDELPECEGTAGDDEETDDEGHVWEQPYDVVGGIRSNPGVWSEGGTAMKFREVCRLCGCYKTTERPGSQRNPGEPLETTSIEERDEASTAWLKETHEENGFLPAWLAELLGCSLSTRMTEEQAREFIASYGDDDEIPEVKLEHAWAATFGRRPTNEERERGLWSSLVA